MNFQTVEGSQIHDLYWRNEEKCRKYTKIICSFVFFHLSAFMVVFVVAIYHVSVGHYDASTWNMFFFMVVPFDKTTVRGYFLLWFYQLNIALFYISSMTTTTSYFMSCSYYIDAMCSHYIYFVNLINENVKHIQFGDYPYSIERNRKKLTDQLCDVIKFHNKIFE